MEINIETAKQEFIRYTSNYDLKNEHIDGKKYHSFRVMEISKQIAQKMKLEKEEIELATLIGLLHDIARFEQYKQFKTFRDVDSFDHGDYAIKILDKNIRNYIQTDKYDEIIKIAIKNHNKFEIEKGLNDKQELFSKIIRDADKIDIMYESIEMFWKNEEEQINNSMISEKVWKQIKNEQLIKREKGVNLENIDDVLSVIAFIYDINFKESFQILRDKNYIDLIINRFELKDNETKKKVEEIRKNTKEYIEQKAKDGK